MTVLHREQKGIERLHGGFARVQKGFDVMIQIYFTRN